MARLMPTTDQNMTDATWGLLQDFGNNFNSLFLTTNYADTRSGPFTPGAVTYLGILIYVSQRTSSSGTLSVSLYNNTLAADVAGTEITINLTDIPATGTNSWHFFRWPAPVTLTAGQSYSAQAKTSITSVVVLGGSPFSWSLLTTTQRALISASDYPLIIGEHTGPGALTTRTVTMDQTSSAFIYGTPITGFFHDAWGVGCGGILNWGVAAATNYFMKTRGRFQVADGGIMNMKNFPSNTTAIIEQDSNSFGDSIVSFWDGAIVDIQGTPKTNAITYLTANTIVGATVLQVVSTAGWSNGDQVIVCSTNQEGGSASTTDLRTIVSVDSPTQITISSGLSQSKLGSATPPMRAEVGNLTRSQVRIRGESLALPISFQISKGAIVNIEYVEFTRAGGITHAFVFGLGETSGVGSLTVNGCTLYDVTGTQGFAAFNLNDPAVSNFNLNNTIVFQLAHSIYIQQATTGTWSITNNLFCQRQSVNSWSVLLADIGGTYTNNTSINRGTGVIITEVGGSPVNFSNNNFHSTGGFAGSLVAAAGGTFGALWLGGCSGNYDNNTFWHCVHGPTVSARNAVISNSSVVGSFAINISIINPYNVLISNCTFDRSADLATPTGIAFQGNSNATLGSLALDVEFRDCEFGVVSPHTQDINFGGPNTTAKIDFTNCVFSSPTEMTNTANFVSGYLRHHNKDQVANDHRTITPSGVITRDISIFDVTPSQRLTPSSASVKLNSAEFQLPINNGSTIDVTVKIRKSVVGDGAAYNGAQPRLIVKANYAAGILTDTVIATATNAANGAFEEVTGTTPAVTEDTILNFYVDCDGTAGWVNIDTIVGPVLEAGDMKHWRNALPSPIVATQAEPVKVANLIRRVE